MKKLLLVLAVVASAVTMNAQSIGIQAGLNFAQGAFDEGISADSLKSITGIRIGPVFQFPLGTILELHTGAIYSQRGYEITEQARIGKYTIDYIEIPIALAASFDLGGIGAFVKGGPILGIGIGGKKTLQAGTTDFEFGSGADETKVLDTGGTLCAGVKLGTLQIEASYDFSLTDLSNNNAGYKNKVFHLALSFVIGR